MDEPWAWLGICCWSAGNIFAISTLQSVFTSFPPHRLPRSARAYITAIILINFALKKLHAFCRFTARIEALDRHCTCGLSHVLVLKLREVYVVDYVILKCTQKWVSRAWMTVEFVLSIDLCLKAVSACHFKTWATALTSNFLDCESQH